jgi:hypothetical protein
MFRRTCALLLLFTLSGQVAVSLYACHAAGARPAAEPTRARVAVEHRNTTPAHAHSGELAAARSAEHKVTLPHRSHRHRPGDCPHGRGAAALHPCQGDPVVGLQLAAGAGLPSRAATFIAVSADRTVDPSAPAHAPGESEPSPESPPPRTV